MRIFSACLLACATFGQVPSYVISTVAGSAPVSFPPQGTTAADVRLLLPAFAAVDASGNVYVSDSYYDRILRITPAGAVTTFAGSETGFGGDDRPATAAQFNGVEALAFGPAGDLFVCDRRNGRVRKITRAGVISTVAGNGTGATPADGRPAVSGGGGNPKGIAIDAAGNVYFSDNLNHIVRRVDSAGNITTVAGVAGRPGFSGDRGPATAATLQSPAGLAVDTQGNLYIADTANNRVRRVSAQGVIDTVAGNGIAGETGDAGAATAAQINGPNDVAVNSDGHLFIANRPGGRVRRVRGTTITTVAGSGTSRTFPSQATRFSLALPGGIALTAGGDLIVVDDGRRQVYQVNLTADSIQVLAGAVGGDAFGDNGPATSGKLLQPQGVAVDADGNLFITDLIDNRVRRVSVSTGVITTLAGTGALALTDGLGRGADVGRPRAVAFDRNRNLYVTASWGAAVRRITPAGNVTTFAGGANAGFTGDGGPATSARMFAPQGVAIDRQDNVYIADSANNRIRRVTPNGVINTIAGTGERAYGGDAGPALLARLSGPQGLVIDERGNLFVADTGNHRVRRIDPSGNITTVAGNGEPGRCNADVPATQLPTSLAFDTAGNLLIANAGSGQICALSATDGKLTVIAGSTGGFAGDGGPATEAKLSGPQGIATGPDGAIYVVDTNNERVRKLELVRLAAGGIQSLASRLPGAVAPYQLVSIQGLGLGPATAVNAEADASGKWPKTLGGTRVLFDGVAAALLSTQERQVVAAVPAGVGESIKVRVEFQGRLTNEVTLAGVAAAPGIFVRDGQAQAAAVNEDGKQNEEVAPAAVGSVLTFNVTGMGLLDAALEDGQSVADDAEVRPTQPVEVTVGGVAAEVVSARVPARQLPGVVAVRVRIPEGVEPGAAVALVVKSGGASSQAGVTVSVASAVQP